MREKMSLNTSGFLETEVQHQLDGRLEVAIDELREKSEVEISEYKLQLETMYKSKVRSTQLSCVVL